MRVLLIDVDLPHTRALSRFHSIFSIRNGIYSPIQRLRLQKRQGQEIFFLHPNIEYEKNISLIENITPFSHTGEPRPDIRKWMNDLELFRKESEILQKNFSFLFFSNELNLFSFFDELNDLIDRDLHLWTKYNTCKNFSKISTLSKTKNFDLIGDKKNLYIHENAIIHPGVIIDTRNGKVILSDRVEISPFSYLTGPLYVAPNARLDNVRLGSSIIGCEVRAGGEIEKSIIGDYTNKHHEGFLGHSLVGNWVNLGALTTTSDLKNNYGSVRLQIPLKNFLDLEVKNNSDNHKNFSDPLVDFDTKQIKFGSLIGDCVKTSIGTLLNTGTCLDVGSNIFGGNPPKYLPPFSWGISKESSKYELNLFLENTKFIAQRRMYSFPKIWDKIVRDLYERV